ncbi:cytochrome c biogenesis protein ResB [Subtercola boreus]|nr:cytochrome c biogenesis protein ResB [Subtercola boreus]
MRTALFLLLLLALASIPGSLVPQRTADPNGVIQYFADNPQIAPLLDTVQAFDAYSSFWFSGIYILLFVSLIGCVIPRATHHYRAIRAQPPRTPSRLGRLPAFDTVAAPDAVSDEQLHVSAKAVLRRRGYRVATFQSAQERSVSAERGYLRETGNLVFHVSLVGLLAAVAVGGLFGYAGQRVVIEGTGFANAQASYDSFTPGRWFDPATLDPYTLTLDEFTVDYETRNEGALGQPLEYQAAVTVNDPDTGSTSSDVIKVNRPLEQGANDVFLLGNGYAPEITVRDNTGAVIFSEPVAFLPQDSNLTSLGVVKILDGLPSQLGLIGFFYPTEATSDTGAKYSSFPDLIYPVMTLNVFEGDLGVNNGSPISAYSLDTSNLTQLTGGASGAESIQLKIGESADLPNQMGTISLDGVRRFASFDMSSDPAQDAVLVFAVLATVGLLTSLFIPRRRLWVKILTHKDGTRTIEYAGLVRGDDPHLHDAVAALQKEHREHYSSASRTGPTGEPDLTESTK